MGDRRFTLVHITSSLKMGGAETVLYNLVTALGNQQFDHHVIYFYDGPFVDDLQLWGIKTYHIQGLFFRYDPVFFFRLTQCVKKINPDCIHSLLWAGNVTARMVAQQLKIPCISVFHNPVDQDGKIRSLFDQMTIRHATQLVAVSDAVAESVRRRNRFMPAREVTVIPNGIDVHDIQKKVQSSLISRYQLGLSEEHIVIGSVGRFELVKRYDLLLDSFVQVFQRIPYARLVLVGSGSHEQKLRDKAYDLGITEAVIFVVGQKAYGYYRLFDCFVQSSDSEGVSIALLEAMSCGLPVVVTAPEKKHPVITAHTDGFVVNPGDCDVLADVLCTIVSDKRLAQTVGDNARQTVVHEFNSDTMVHSYKNIIVSLCEKK